MTPPHSSAGPQIARQVLIGLLLAFILVVIVETTRSFDGRFGWTYGTTVEADARGISVRQGDGRHRFLAELEGEVRFDADETRIERMAADAYLELEEDGRSGHRRLEARPAAGGTPELRWWLDHERQQPDAAAHAWLATAIPRLLRVSGVDVEGRVARFLAKGGVAAVLAETEQITTDAILRSYFEQLFAQAQVEGDDLAHLLRIAAREIGSDAELGTVLALVPVARFDSPELHRLYLRAAETIGTDAELRPTLARLVADPALDGDTLDALLAVAETIGTDAELRPTLARLVADPALDGDTLDALLAVAETIGTDAELSELLTLVAQSWAPDRELPPSFAGALSTIGTDAEQRRALEAAFRRPALSDQSLDDLLSSATHIGTDAELAAALETLLAARPRGWVPPRAFWTAVDTIGTRSERERLAAIVPAPAVEG